MSGDAALEAVGIHKSFGGVAALRGVDLRLCAGEIHALLGQNGAGKSTLVKILNGVHPAGSFQGTIRVAGVATRFHSPAEARARGVAYVPQEIEVLETLSAAENVFAGRTGLGRSVLVRRRAMEDAAAALFAELGLPIEPAAPAASLTSAQRHLLMIVRALATGPAVLMLDEPTASLSTAEVERLVAVMRQLRARGTALVHITHRLAEVLAVCDQATVLRDGLVAARFAAREFDTDQLITAMTGRRVERLYPARAATAERPEVLRVDDLSVAAGRTTRRALSGISFALREGEILGVAGLVGSGRTELLGALFGRHPFTGRIAVAGRPASLGSPRLARAAGLALLTEDRKRDGLVFNLPVGGNVSIGNLERFATGGMVRRGRERRAVVQALQALNVKARSPDSLVAHLSGGNQQKLLFARVLMNRPRVLLLDEPTKGVDMATRQEIYRLVVDLAATGVGIVLVSSELEEVIGLADRILVLARGHVVDRFSRGEGGEDRVFRAIAAAEALRPAA